MGEEGNWVHLTRVNVRGLPSQPAMRHWGIKGGETEVHEKSQTYHKGVSLDTLVSFFYCSTVALDKKTSNKKKIIRHPYNQPCCYVPQGFFEHFHFHLKAQVPTGGSAKM